MSDEATSAGHAAQQTADTQHLLSQLQTAAEDLASTRTMDHEDRVTASSVAHQLAHALTLAGSTDAAAKARDIIATLDHEGLPQPERLQQQVQTLAELLDR